MDYARDNSHETGKYQTWKQKELQLLMFGVISVLILFPYFLSNDAQWNISFANGAC